MSEQWYRDGTPHPDDEDKPAPARHVALAWAVPYVDGGFVERDGLPSFWKSREDAQEWLDDYGNPGERVVRVRVETVEITEDT